MFQSKTETIRIIQVLLEGVQQQVELVAGAQQNPILVGKICEQCVAIANVHDVLYSEDIQIFDVQLLNGLSLGFQLCIQCLRTLLIPSFNESFLVLLALLLSCFCLLGLGSFAACWVLVVCMSLAPLRQSLLPYGILLLEASSRLQILGSLRQLLLHDPVLQQLGAVGLFRPSEADLVKAFSLGRQSEASIRLGELFLSQVEQLRLPEALLLLLLCQLNWCCCLLHLGILPLCSLSLCLLNLSLASFLILGLGLLTLSLFSTSLSLLSALSICGALGLLRGCSLPGLLSLLSLCFPQLQHLFPILFLRFLLVLCICLGLLLCKQSGVHSLLEVLGGLAHQNNCLSVVVLPLVAQQRLLPL
mmetsp:Transcript_57742/g.103732  ORF Transcript_57742/g.103732 Transcript_57742/m.103732 type:complete len:360 (-) Transcript_57742:230-1309(-)